MLAFLNFYLNSLGCFFCEFWSKVEQCIFSQKFKHKELDNLSGSTFNKSQSVYTVFIVRADNDKIGWI